MEVTFSENIDWLKYTEQVAEMYAKVERREKRVEGAVALSLEFYATTYEDLIGRIQVNYLRAKVVWEDNARRYFWIGYWHQA